MSLRAYLSRLWDALLGRPLPAPALPEPAHPTCSQDDCESGVDRRCLANQCARCCAAWCTTAGRNGCREHYAALTALVIEERRLRLRGGVARSWKDEN